MNKDTLDALLVSLQTDYPAMGSEQHETIVAAVEGIIRVVGGGINYTGDQIEFGSPLCIDLTPEYAELFIHDGDDYHFTFAELQELREVAEACSLAVDIDPALLLHAYNIEHDLKPVLNNETNKGKSK